MKHITISFGICVHERDNEEGNRLTSDFVQKQISHLADTLLSGFDETIHDVKIVDDTTGDSVMNPDIPIFP